MRSSDRIISDEDGNKINTAVVEPRTPFDARAFFLAFKQSKHIFKKLL